MLLEPCLALLHHGKVYTLHVTCRVPDLLMAWYPSAHASRVSWACALASELCCWPGAASAWSFSI